MQREIKDVKIRQVLMERYGSVPFDAYMRRVRTIYDRVVHFTIFCCWLICTYCLWIIAQAAR